MGNKKIKKEKKKKKKNNYLLNKMDQEQEIIFQEAYDRNYLTMKELDKIIEHLRVKAQKQEAEHHVNNPQNNNN